jgi:hypothetical protein
VDAMTMPSRWPVWSASVLADFEPASFEDPFNSSQIAAMCTELLAS